MVIYGSKGFDVMEKTEFLEQLRLSLNGKLEPQEVADNLRYYEDYINTQIRLGKSEEEVMTVLGSPRLIARSITDASGITVQEYEENTVEQEDPYGGSRHGGIWFMLLEKYLNLPKWLRTAVNITAFILFLWLALTILKALLPLILILVVVLMMAKFFRDLK